MSVRILRGHVLDRLRELPDESVHCCVTSPPYYGLRDYGVPGQLGLEPTLQEYLDNMVAVFREVRRVLRSDGTLWLNIGDSYAAQRGGSRQPAETLAGGVGGVALDGGRVNRDRFDGYNPTRNASSHGLKHKDLMGVPWRLAFALQADGWYLRSEIIWHKKSCMPESVRDRPTKSHEHIFLLAKSESYYYDQVAASEPVEGVERDQQESRRARSAAGHKSEPTNERNGMRVLVGIGHNKRERKAVQNAASRLLAEGANRRTGGAISGGVDASTLGVPAAVSRNWRDVWSLGPEPFKESHFATFPTEIPRRAIVAGCPVGGTVLDPFLGSGTTALVADRLQRDCIGIELNPAYADMAERRIRGDAPLLAEVA